MTLLIISSPSSLNNGHRAPVFPLIRVYTRFSLPQGALANVTTSPAFSWALPQLPSARCPASKKRTSCPHIHPSFFTCLHRGEAAGEDEEEMGRRGTWTKAKFSCVSSRRQKNTGPRPAQPLLMGSHKGPRCAAGIPAPPLCR